MKYTIDQIRRYMDAHQLGRSSYGEWVYDAVENTAIHNAINLLNDARDGIAAVTRRDNGGKR